MADLAIPEKNKFMRYLSIILIIATFIIAGCKTVKKVEAIQNSITKKDTALRVIVSDVPKVDSETIVKGIMAKVMKKKIDFITFNAKVKVDYEGSADMPTVSAYISIQKDSLVYIKITHPLAGLLYQVKVNRDSVVLLDMKKKKTEKKAISYLQDVTQIPFDFGTLQDIIVGNPIFLDSNVVSYKATANQLLVLMVGEVFKHSVTLNNGNFTVLHSKLDDVDINRNRTCDITFGNYQSDNNNLFAAYRKISIAEKSKMDLTLDFKEHSFNDPLKYAFTIPKNFRRK
jgi:hypothetical protein